MTKLTKDVRRLVAEEDLIVSLTPFGVTVREKGRRTVYGPLPYGWLRLKAAERMAEQRRAERAKKRKVRRGLLAR